MAKFMTNQKPPIHMDVVSKSYKISNWIIVASVNKLTEIINIVNGISLVELVANKPNNYKNKIHPTGNKQLSWNQQLKEDETENKVLAGH